MTLGQKQFWFGMLLQTIGECLLKGNYWDFPQWAPFYGFITGGFCLFVGMLLWVHAANGWIDIKIKARKIHDNWRWVGRLLWITIVFSITQDYYEAVVEYNTPVTFHDALDYIYMLSDDRSQLEMLDKLLTKMPNQDLNELSTEDLLRLRKLMEKRK